VHFGAGRHDGRSVTDVFQDLRQSWTALTAVPEMQVMQLHHDRAARSKKNGNAGSGAEAAKSSDHLPKTAQLNMVMTHQQFAPPASTKERSAITATSNTALSGRLPLWQPLCLSA